MLSKPVDQITASDLEELIENQVEERHTLDYKRDLPGRTDRDKQELRADATSFANSSGGIILFGIEEDGDGKPVSITGIAGEGQDEAIRRIEQTLASCVEPPIPGIQSHAITSADESTVIAVRIPKSWRSPHLVNINDSYRMYARTSRGKQPLDAREIRLAFEGANELSERISRWRDDRIAKILAGDTPVALETGPHFVLHIIPLNSFTNSMRIPMPSLAGRTTKFRPMGANSWNDRVNLDGFLTYGGKSASGDYYNDTAYTQVFRSGAIEAVAVDIFSDNTIPSGWYERVILEGAAQYINSLGEYDIDYPISILISVINAKGKTMGVADRYSRQDLHPINRDPIFLPEIVLEQAPTNLPKELKPAFDALWNECGIIQSGNYDTNGNWINDRLSGVPMDPSTDP